MFHKCIPYDKGLSCGTIIFDLMTLTLKFDLLLKNFNISHNCDTIRGTCRDFIFHKCIPYDKAFHVVP